jgi:hypothetical protein
MFIRSIFAEQMYTSHSYRHFDNLSALVRIWGGAIVSSTYQVVLSPHATCQYWGIRSKELKPCIDILTSSWYHNPMT